ncbi:MAG: rhomboid family intramembrane serine protease [Lachnospiraceae bacterium]|jgi:rhomboid protease GluP
MEQFNFQFYWSYLIILANVIVFILETIRGGSTKTENAVRFGAQSCQLLGDGQWYRLFTSMFVHFGFLHLACNMYALYQLGPDVETLLNVWYFLIIYFGSGICGNLLTYFVGTKSGRDSISAGASGAIFGLFGTFLALYLIPETRDFVNAGSLLQTLVINLIYGIVNRRINLWAHLGGLAGGTVLSLVIIGGILRGWFPV